VAAKGKENERGSKNGKRLWVEAEKQLRCRDQQRIQIAQEKEEFERSDEQKNLKKARLFTAG